jgi:hypothetical protein
MDDKKAATILMSLLDKNDLKDEEKEAIRMAIGLFSWTALSQSRVKKLKDKQEKSANW